MLDANGEYSHRAMMFIMIGISGGFNEIKGSNFALQWPLKNEKSYPKISDMFIVQPLRIGGELYE